MSRMSDDGAAAGVRAAALGLLRVLTGDPGAAFRAGQLDAIDRIVRRRQRVLLVQRTGWGKSAVYFIATYLMRQRGAGPTLLVSPLLALMRNQIDAAQRMGLRAATINSANTDDWPQVRQQLADDAVDVLLISPERLANPDFGTHELPEVGRRSGLLVIDEAHCISDWGHDFRPDYRRITRVLGLLPTGVPVLCCTATANDRVIDDVVAQLGGNLDVLRGALRRPGLGLHVLSMPSQAERLTWLAHVVPHLPGTGIIYCLTIADTERVADWLRATGIRAVAYSGPVPDDERVAIEKALLANDVKVVVATSALGMGFDKPDLSFVIHYQSPGSPIAYYQQVGRAGRGLAESWGILLAGTEDADIQDYFIRTAFPPPDLARNVVALLERVAAPMSTWEMQAFFNVRYGTLEKLLKNLEVEGAVERTDEPDGTRWLRTLNRWNFDSCRVKAVTALRREEQDQMRTYIEAGANGAGGCRMQLLGSYLGDEMPTPCGICDLCTGRSLRVQFDPAEVQRAVEHLRGAERGISPRRMFPDRRWIPMPEQLQPGRVLGVWGDGGWGSLVASGRRQGRFDDQLVAAAVELILERWQPDPAPTWVTFVPSQRHPGLVADFARRLAAALGLPCKDVVAKVQETQPQREMQNSHHQYNNVREAFKVQGSVRSGRDASGMRGAHGAPQAPEAPDATGMRSAVRPGPVLLVDDTVDSKWTMTVVGIQLRQAGAGPVYPFALADTAGRTATTPQPRPTANSPAPPPDTAGRAATTPQPRPQHPVAASSAPTANARRSDDGSYQYPHQPPPSSPGRADANDPSTREPRRPQQPASNPSGRADANDPSTREPRWPQRPPSSSSGRGDIAERQESRGHAPRNGLRRRRPLRRKPPERR